MKRFNYLNSALSIFHKNRIRSGSLFYYTFTAVITVRNEGNLIFGLSNLATQLIPYLKYYEVKLRSHRKRCVGSRDSSAYFI